MKCQYCEKETFLPFRCTFCSGYFCVKHRLPENHACPEYWRAKIPRREEPSIIIESRPERVPYQRVAPYAPRPRTEVFWFSFTELKHLALGALLVMGVGASLFWLASVVTPGTLVSLSAVFTSAFFLHEIAHKLVAQRHGLWAEFRLTLTGALITLLSIISPVKIISPGAVMIVGARSRETLGKVSLAGPLTNLVLSIIFLGVASISPIYLVGCFFNAFIALVNLIPFGLLDGLKVFLWSKRVWGVAFVLSAALSAWTLFMFIRFRRRK